MENISYNCIISIANENKFNGYEKTWCPEEENCDLLPLKKCSQLFFNNVVTNLVRVGKLNLKGCH